MAYSNGIITPPVSIRDIQQALGSSSTDLATLIINGNVNRWSRYKPVANEPWEYMSQMDSDKNWKNDATWFYNTLGGFYGIEIDQSKIVYEELKVITDRSADEVWVYTKPWGAGSNDPAGNSRKAPYRMTDFAHYCQLATFPLYNFRVFKGSTVNPTSIIQGDPLSCAVSPVAGTMAQYCLPLSALTGTVANWYFCAVLVDVMGATQLAMASKPLGEYDNYPLEATSCTLMDIHFTGTVKAVPALTNLSNSKFIRLPLSYITTNVQEDASYAAKMSYYFYINKNNGKWKLQVLNYGGSAGSAKVYSGSVKFYTPSASDPTTDYIFATLSIGNLSSVTVQPDRRYVTLSTGTYSTNITTAKSLVGTLVVPNGTGTETIEITASMGTTDP